MLSKNDSQELQETKLGDLYKTFTPKNLLSVRTLTATTFKHSRQIAGIAAK